MMKKCIAKGEKINMCKLSKKGTVLVIVVILFMLLSICLFASDSFRYDLTKLLTGQRHNDKILKNATDAFVSELEKTEGVSILEVHSVCGKLNGNGNGMNYFGCVLARVERPETLRSICSGVQSKDERFEVVDWYLPEGKVIDTEYVERSKFSFDLDIDETNADVFCIYFYDSGNPKSNEWDPRGH